MELFFVMWIATILIGIYMEASFILDVCTDIVSSGFKIDKEEIKKLILPQSILFLPIFNLPFISAQKVKYILNPNEYLKEVKITNAYYLTSEEIEAYNEKPTALTIIKIFVYNKLETN